MQGTKHLSKPQVCVVGAGISGLRTANLLVSAGFEVTILEARDRIGGRIQQRGISELGCQVDVGASWIHGTEGNPFVELAKLTATPTVPCGAVYSIFDTDADKHHHCEGKQQGGNA